MRAFDMADLGRVTPEPSPKGVTHLASYHLADERDAMTAKARAAREAYDDATLARWYDMQLADVRHQVAEIEAKFCRNMDRMAGAGVDDKRWPLLWRQQAKIAYLTQTAEGFGYGRGTLPLLEEAGHVLVCPVHGIDGDVFAELAQEHNEGLSLLGILEGGLATHASWQRFCMTCADGTALKILADHFQREWVKA